MQNYWIISNILESIFWNMIYGENMSCYYMSGLVQDYVISNQINVA